MSVFEDLGPKTGEMSRMWRGTIHSNPTAVNQRIDVILPDIPVPIGESPRKWQHCRWEPRYIVQQVVVSEGADIGGDSEPSHSVPIPQILYPKRGNLCLCIFDNTRELWVVMWWPF